MGEREDWRGRADGGRMAVGEGGEDKRRELGDVQGDTGCKQKTQGMERGKNGDMERPTCSVDVHINCHKNNKHRKKQGS